MYIVVDSKETLREDELRSSRAAYTGRGEPMISCQIHVDFVLSGSQLADPLGISWTVLGDRQNPVSNVRHARCKLEAAVSTSFNLSPLNLEFVHEIYVL